MLTPFEAGKTAKELGIDTTREFVVVSENTKSRFSIGDVLTFDRQDGYEEHHPRAYLFRHKDSNLRQLISLEHLAYAPQSDVSPEKHALREAIDPLQVATGTTVSSPTEEYTPQVGDIVKLEGKVSEIDEDGSFSVEIAGRYGTWWQKDDYKKHITLISRKAKRKVTMEEIRKLLGEDVEIVDPLPTQQEEKAIYEKMYHVCNTGCSIPCPNKV